MKIALIHDWLTGMRGGEKVLEIICRMYPEAPLHTLVYVRENMSPTITSHPVKTSALQHLPLGISKYRHYLPLFPLLTEFNKVKDADLVISTSHAVAKAMLVKKRGAKRPVHICYIHTPMRYVWDRFDDYFGPERVGWLASTLFFKPIAWFLRQYDVATNHRVDQFVANSSFVAGRVKEFYGRDALVLPAPVNLSHFSQVKRNPQDFYLVVSALVPYKKVDQAIEACSQLGRALKIVGAGPEEKNLKALAEKRGAKVEFLGSVSNEDLMKAYGEARALLFPGVEDFGIVPVEAIASGCPVIALARGGVLDSMTDQTALFYKESTIEGLVSAIQEFEKTGADRFKEEILRKRSQDFSEENFERKLRDIINETWKKHA